MSLEYAENSTILGSMNTNFNSEGCLAYSNEATITFSPTDLPILVAPAIRRCGESVRSNTLAFWVMVYPRAIGSSPPLLRKASSLSMDLRGTMEGVLLATSMPTESDKVTTRTPLAFNDTPISSWRFLIAEILTPGPGYTLYRVTVGPTTALTSNT